MGEWHETCVLTGLPVRLGDAVRVFAVADAGRESAARPPQGESFPLSLGISGTYNGVGGFTPDSSVEMDFSSEYLGLDVIAGLQQGGSQPACVHTWTNEDRWDIRPAYVHSVAYAAAIHHSGKAHVKAAEVKAAVRAARAWLEENPEENPARVSWELLDVLPDNLVVRNRDRF